MKKKKYEKPQLKVVEVKVERGFVVSGEAPTEQPQGTEQLTEGRGYFFN